MKKTKNIRKQKLQKNMYNTKRLNLYRMKHIKNSIIGGASPDNIDRRKSIKKGKMPDGTAKGSVPKKPLSKKRISGKQLNSKEPYRRHAVKDSSKDDPKGLGSLSNNFVREATMQQLREELNKRGLNQFGSRDILQKRLQEFLNKPQ